MLTEALHDSLAAAESTDGAAYIMAHLVPHPIVKVPTVLGVDLTLTNHVIAIFVTAALLTAMFFYSFRKKKEVYTGLAGALEAVAEYLMKEAIRPNLGADAKTYAPYLLTAFFFILVCNLLGLVPFGNTATGNISVTLTLAAMTLLVGVFAGIRKHGLKYFAHFIPSGLPWFIVPIMLPVEIISLFSKHLALAIRLFANMIGGHITILALMDTIFIFHEWIVSPFPLILVIFASTLEVLIAFIQAFVFTTLSSVFIGSALSEEH
ncbi:MAG: F0F1 ATP synthase subunit A [candidate division KSB1 bacterium]|nr:F0F1 ATP synthase subunit A [candidate division KSB1 bacterium]MDZ7346305.1 F0F1 ATP synthase subunit A [candidate division KSB1 bacterium]